MDHEKVIKEANHLIAEWSTGKIDPKDPATRSNAQVEKLQRQLDNIAAIDFFEAPERGTANLLIRDLAAISSGRGTDAVVPPEGIGTLKDKVWVTRQNIFVDRVACGWLIRRFVDDAAIFKYVDSDTYAPNPGEIRFDMFEGEFTHKGDRCTFEVMTQRLNLQESGLASLAEVIHDIDLKDNKYHRSETDGMNALLIGLAASEADDDKRMTKGAQLMENLYAWFRLDVARSEG